ncbi:MAG: hypothetical protein WDN75_03380 [Bacteroidota bacterium]
MDAITRLEKENLFYTAANSSLRTETFKALGGFDARLNDAEDFDLAYRALSAKMPVFFDKENEAVHHELITCVSYIRRLREYNEAHGKLRTFYPDRENGPRINKINPVKKVMYKFFAASLWPGLIDKQFFKKILPRTVRYKFYDLVIESLTSQYPAVKV